MKKLLIPSVGMAVLALVCTGWAAEKAPPKVVAVAHSELVSLGLDPVVVEAVKRENAKVKSLDPIQKMDADWQATAGLAPYMKEFMESPCGKHLIAYQNSREYIAEIFVTDNQGANVAMTDKTSDYWQGDEAKFSESFTGGVRGNRAPLVCNRSPCASTP